MFPGGKRFPKTPTGETPGPGAYEVEKFTNYLNDAPKHYGFIEKSKRFKSPKLEENPDPDASISHSVSDIQPLRRTLGMSTSSRTDREEIQKLKREAERWHDQYEKQALIHQKEIGQLEERIQKLDAQLRNAVKERNALNSQTTAKENELGNLKKQYGVLKNQYEKAQEQSSKSSSVSKKVEELEKQKLKETSTLEKRVATLMQDVERVEKALAEERNGRMEDLERFQSQAMRESEEHQQEVEALEKRRMKLEVAAMKAELAENKAALGERDKDIATLMQDVERLEKAFAEERNGRMEDLERFQSQAMRESEKHQQEVEALEKRRMKLEGEVAAMKAELAENKAALGERDKDIATLMQDVERLEKAFAEERNGRMEDLERFQSQAMRESEKHQQEVEALENRKMKLEGEVAAMKTELAENKAVAEARLFDLSNTLERVRSEYEDAKREHDAYATHAIAEIEALNVVKNDLGAEAHTLRRKLDTAESRLGATLHDCEKAHEAMRSLKDGIVQRDATIAEERKARLNDVAAERKRSAGVAEEFKATLAKAESQITALKSQLTTSQNNLSMAEIKMANEIASRDAQLRQLQSLVEDLVGERDHARANVEKRGKEIEKWKEEARKWQEATEHVKDGERKIKVAEQRWAAERQEMLTKITNAETETEERSKEVDRLKARLDESERSKRELEESYATQLDLLRMRGELKQDEVKKLGELNAELFGHANNRQKIKHVATLKEENLKLKADTLNLTRQVEQYRARVNSLQRELDSQRALNTYGPGKKVNGVGRVRAALAAQAQNEENQGPLADEEKKENKSGLFFVPLAAQARNEENQGPPADEERKENKSGLFFVPV
ncbi:hypothetical protein HK104_001981 [Borealophlyctis nickersoniae]|nr:hypothetical protein HK104_001981 [Borealophlyctis nickersoniae]